MSITSPKSKPQGREHCTFEGCHKSYSRKSRLREHIRKAHLQIQQVFTCGVCAKSFNERGVFRTHLRLHSGFKPYDCFHCGKQFYSLGNRNDHQRRHLKIKKHFCTLCHKSYYRKYQLTKHLQSHQKKQQQIEGSHELECIKQGQEEADSSQNLDPIHLRNSELGNFPKIKSQYEDQHQNIDPETFGLEEHSNNLFENRQFPFSYNLGNISSAEDFDFGMANYCISSNWNHPSDLLLQREMICLPPPSMQRTLKLFNFQKLDEKEESLDIEELFHQEILNFNGDIFN